MADVTSELTQEQKIALNIVTLNTAVNSLQEDFRHDHKVLVEGNGQVPLVEKVRRLEDFMNGVNFWTRTVAVAIILQTLAFAGAAIWYAVKLLPLLNSLALK